MKLCIVTHNIIRGNGQGRTNYEIVQEAIRRGHQVTLVANRIDPGLQRSPAVQSIHIPPFEGPDLIGNLLFLKASAQWLQQHRQTIDVINVNGAASLVRSDINSVHFVHSTWLNSPAQTSRQVRHPYGLYQSLYTRVSAHLEHKALLKAQQIVAVSAKIKAELIEVGIPRDRISVIWNGVDLDEFYPGAAARQQWDLPAAVTLGLFAGDIRSNRKNLDTVFKALVQIPELHLAVAGDTTGSIYPQLATQLGIADRVHFLGMRQDLAALMRASDFFVFPSHYEPFGLVVLEAMASGLPVIVSKNMGVAEIVSSECGFILSESQDLDTLIKALHRLTQSPNLRLEMGRNARNTAQRHSWKSKAEDYVDLYEKSINLSLTS